MEETTTQTIAEIDCPYCAEKINGKAKKCKHCGEIIDTQMRDIELLKSKMNNSQVITNVATNTGSPGVTHIIVNKKSRGAAVLWAFFLGGIGAHKFYLGQNGTGMIYLLLSWTSVPFIISICEGIYYLCMSPAEFDAKYNTYTAII